MVPERKTSLGIPLMSILASRATWAYFLVHLANDYGFYLILTEGPNFIYNVLDKDIKEVTAQHNCNNRFATRVQKKDNVEKAEAPIIFNFYWQIFGQQF